MQLLKSRRLMLIFISFALIFVFGVMTSVAQEKQIREFLQKSVQPSGAQEKIKLKDQRFWVTTKMEILKTGDTEGHIVQMSEAKGVDVGTSTVAISVGFWDLVKGNGTHDSYVTNTDTDGDVWYCKTQGKVTTTLSPAGKPVTTIYGTFSLIRGTGKWEGFHGGGSWNLKMMGPGISVMDWEGEFTKK